MEIEKIKYWINDHPTALKKSAIRANLYKPCKKLFEENAQAALEIDDLWKLLSFPNKPLFVLIYHELMQRISSPFAEGNDFTGVKLYFLGAFTASYKEKIKEVLQKFGVEISERLDETVTFVMLGYRVGKGVYELLEKGIYFILPDHLESLLNKYENQETNTLDNNEQQNLGRLLLSQEESNQKIGVEILKQQTNIVDGYLIYIVHLIGKEIFLFPIYLYEILRDDIYLPYSLKLFPYKPKKRNLHLTKFQNIWMDQEKFIKIGLDLFEQEHLKYFYYHFLDLGFLLNLKIADEYLQKEIKDGILDLRNLSYKIEINIIRSYYSYVQDYHYHMNFVNFNGSKFPNVKELWLRSKRGENLKLHLHIIRSFAPNQLEKIKITYTHNRKDKSIPHRTKEFWKKNYKRNNLEIYIEDN